MLRGWGSIDDPCRQREVKELMTEIIRMGNTENDKAGASNADICICIFFVFVEIYSKTPTNSGYDQASRFKS